MWNFIGDHDFQTNSDKFNGTYFFKTEKHKLISEVHWKILDQVLVSEPIVDALNPQNIEIVTQYNTGAATVYLAHKDFYFKNRSYLNPNFSDHLPIRFLIETSKLT